MMLNRRFVLMKKKNSFLDKYFKDYQSVMLEDVQFLFC